MQKLDCKDLHGYVLTLSPQVLEQLYGHPATCLAIFRLVLLTMNVIAILRLETSEFYRPVSKYIHKNMHIHEP